MSSLKADKNNLEETNSLAIKEHFRFENLLGLLSAKLVNLPVESIDKEIKETIKLLADFFHADRCHIGKVDINEDKIIVSHYYAKPDVSIPQVSSIGEHSYSYIYNQINKGKRVFFSLPEELPNEASDDRDEFIKSGIKSLLIIPLIINDEVKYGLSLSTVVNQCQWHEYTIKHVQIIGDIIASVLSRKIILAQVAKEKLWAESILQGMPQIAYVFDSKGRLKRWNSNLERILGYSSNELQNKFITEFNADYDNERVEAEVLKIFEDGTERIITEDLVTKSGEVLHYFGSGKRVEIDGEFYLIGMTVDITELTEARQKIEHQLNEINELKEQLYVENIVLRQEIESTSSFQDIIGEHETLKHTLYRVSQVAPMDTTVLLEGETGTGKELFARAIHTQSNRRQKPLIIVNCASIPSNLIESELFGHEKGSFTGAITKHIGKFELANNGTLFLDEVGELPYNIQAKLLRVLQEGTFERIGGAKTIKVDVRVIAATNRILEVEVENKLFRSDLYYRLNVYPISIVPLRERVSDIEVLVEHFVNKYNSKFGKKIKSIPKKSMQLLKQYSWPGNVRELENIIERALIISTSTKLNVEQLPNKKNIEEKEELLTLQEYERSYIISVLEKTYWRVDGPNGAAIILDIHPETLRSRMRKLQIQRPN